MSKTKLAAEAIRIYSYQLARDLLQRAIETVPEGGETSQGQGGVAVCDLEKQLDEKDALIKQLKAQLESLQQQIATSAKSEPSKRRLRSLHQVKSTSVKVDEEAVDCSTEKVCLSRKGSLENMHSRSDCNACGAGDMAKTPSLKDLEACEKPAEEGKAGEQVNKPNIFNVEYEEFAQQIKAELASSPADSQPSEFISPDFFRQKEAKAVLNWTNLQSPQEPVSPPADSLSLKEAERPHIPSPPSIWTDMKPKSRGKPVRPVLPRPTALPITLDRKLRAKSQVHSNRPAEISELKPASRGRRSTPASKGVSPRTMNQTIVEGLRPRKGSQGTRRGDSRKSLEPGAKPLEALLSEASDAQSWAGLMQEMKANPTYLSELLTPVPIAPPRLVFRRASHSHQAAAGLNCVLEEDEDSSRSHYDPVPELSSTKGSLRSEGPVLVPTSRQHSASVPRRRPKPADWSDSPLDAFALGGNLAFNWDRRSGIYSEKEADSAYFRLHSHPDPQDLPLVYSKACTTLARLLDELLLPRDYIQLQGGSKEGAVYALRQIKRLLDFRRLTVRILSRMHEREDQLLTLMSLEEGSESLQLAQRTAALGQELQTLLSRWKAAGFPYPAFLYLGTVRTSQDYAEKLQGEL